MSATYHTEEFLSKVQKMEFDEMLVRQQLSPLHEPETCIVFGCGRHLTLQESLQGNKCSHCLSVLPNAAAADPTKFVSY